MYFITNVITAALVAFTFFSFENCNGLKSRNGTETSDSNTTSRKQNSPLNDSPILKLERIFGECFGACPVYDITVYASGKIIFDGKANVKVKGITESHIDKAHLNQLIRLFKDSGFTNLKDQYVRGNNCSSVVLSDSTFVSITFYDKEMTKKVHHYLGCIETVNSNDSVNRDLEILYKLEDSVDKAVNSEQWIK